VAEAAKRPFDFEVAVERLRRAVRDYPPAVMYALHDEGFGALWQQVVACIISIRTREEVTLPAARRLLKEASTVDALRRLTPERIAALIAPSVFAEPKGRQIQEIARRTLEEYGGELPCDYAVLTALPGVGPKCANLALGVACGLPLVAVDVHVHRVTNRWGYIDAATPERSSEALNRIVPEEYRVELNRLLVPFGRNVCTGQMPRCSTCPLLDMCRQVGVTGHR
jgi:endonuclease-3